MANPQKEDGYTAIANEIIEAIYRTSFSGHELRMILLVLRKTYGFNKIEDAISLSQMMKCLSLSKTRCSQIINKLQLHKIVTVTENINGIGKKYKFNKNFEKWDTVHKYVNRYTKVKRTVTEKCKTPLHKSVNTKDILQKTYYKIQWDAEKMNFSDITTEDIVGWKQAYPALNIQEEIIKIREWVKANPKNIKSNWKRFFVNWFNRSQDRSRSDNYGKPGYKYPLQGQEKSLRDREIDAETERINREYERKKAEKVTAAISSGDDAG